MRAIVTGANGFIGRYLVAALAQDNNEVQAWTRSGAVSDWTDKVEVAAVDVTDSAAVERELARFAPGLIIHLAAQSFPRQSWAEPAATYQTNVVGAIHLLEAVRASPRWPRLMLAGSSAEYADFSDGKPITEDAPTGPNSPYGASKLAADQLAQLYVRRYEIDVVRFRPFFLIGPRKTGDVCSEFARRICAIERGRERALRVGSLDIVRDFLDVRDAVSAIMRIATAGRSGEVYNIASGSGVRIGDVVETFRGLSRATFSVEPDPALLRPLDQKVRVGDPAKLRALGWRPRHDLGDTLRGVLDYWRTADG